MKTLKQGPGENSQPTRDRRLSRGSLGSCAQVQNQPIGAQPGPPSSGFPGFRDFLPVLPWFRRSLERSPRSTGGLAGPLREGSFLSLVLKGILLNIRIHAVQSSPRKQKGWIFFRSCGVLISVICRWQCCSTYRHSVSPPPFAVEKNATKPFATRSVVYFSLLAQVGWFKLHLSPSDSPLWKL